MRSERDFAALMGAGLLISSMCLGVYSLYLKLRFDQWHNFSVLAFLKSIGRNEGVGWLYFPMDWVGLHSVLDWTPLWAVTLVLGFLFLAGSSEG